VSAIQEWLDRNEDGSSRLAMAVSLAITVEPELLRAARLKLCQGVGVEAEGLVWFSPLVATRSPSGITFLSGAFHAVWDKLRQDQVLLESIHELTASFHANISPALKCEEEIVYWALRDSVEATAKITGLLQTIVKTMLGRQQSRLAVWAERALPRFPDSVRNDPAFMMLAQAAFERGGRLGTIAGAANGPLWLKPTASSMIIGVRLFGRAIEFSHPPGPDTITATVPYGNVVRMLVSKTDDFAPSAGWPRQVLLPANTTVTEDVDLEKELFVHPVGGQVFAVTPVHVEGARLSISLLTLSPEDENLATFLRSNLASDFDLVRPDTIGEAVQIANCDIFLCISTGEVTPATDRRELLAKQECRRILYIAPPRGAAYEISVTSTVVDFRQPAEWSSALLELKVLLHQPFTKAGPLFGVPLLPQGHVQRAQDFSALQSALLQLSSHQIILDGKAGSGRSTLAAAVARDCVVRRTFPNGVYWIYANSTTEVSGDGRLFIFDYEVPSPSLIQQEGNSAVLYTKKPRFSGDIPGTNLTVGPWRNDELVELLVPGESVEISTIVELNGNPGNFKLLAAALRRKSMSKRASSVTEQFITEPDVADSIRRLSIFIPDANLAPAVYARVFDQRPSADTLNLLHSAGLVVLSSESRMVIRESLREAVRPLPRLK
jgi:hypothetical protein